MNRCPPSPSILEAHFFLRGHHRSESLSFSERRLERAALAAFLLRLGFFDRMEVIEAFDFDPRCSLLSNAPEMRCPVYPAVELETHVKTLPSRLARFLLENFSPSDVGTYLGLPKKKVKDS